MPGPWEQYQATDEVKPWEKYSAPAAPVRRGAAGIPVGLGASGQPTYADQQAPAPAEQTPEPGVAGMLKRAGKQAYGGLETATSLATGGTTGLIGGILNAANNIAGTVSGLVTGQDVSQRPGPEQAFGEGMQAGTYSPRTQAGQELTEKAGSALQEHGPSLMGVGPELGALGEAVSTAAKGSQGLGLRAAAGSAARSVAELPGQAVPEAVGAAAVKGTQAVKTAVGVPTPEAKAQAAALAQPELEGIREAHDAGYKLTAKAAQAGPGAQMAESAAGPARLAKELSAHNAENTAHLARQDVGLPDDVPATPEATAAIREEAGKDYAAVKDVGAFTNDAQYAKDLDRIVGPRLEAAKDFPELAKNPVIDRVEGMRKDDVQTASAIEIVKDLRNESAKAYRAGDMRLGSDYRALSAAVDNSMERALTAKAAESGDPALAEAVDKYKAARVRIAKTYLLDDAMNGKPGEVDAKVYGRALANGSPLTGPGLQIAKFAKQFGEEGLAQKKGKAGGAGPGYGDILLAALHTPVGAAALVARPAARAALASNFMQRRMAGSKPLPKATEPAAPMVGETGLPSADNSPNTAQTAPVTTDPRLASVEEARAGAQSDAVRAALDEHEKAVRKTLAAEAQAKKQAADVDALEAAAKATQDPDLRKTLQTKADKLRGEKTPVGETKELASTPVPAPEKIGKIPVGKVIEGQPELPAAKPEPIPTGEATEIAPETIEPVEPIPAGEATELPSNVPESEADAYTHRALFDEAAKRGIEVRGRRPSEVRNAFEADWRREHGLGAQDAERAKNTAAALNLDEAAVETAAKQHEKSPRAFDRAVQDIIDRGASNAPETQQATPRGQSNPPNAAGSQASPRAGQAGNANDSAGGASGNQSNPRPGGAAGPTQAAAEQSGANGPSTTGPNAESGVARGQTEGGTRVDEPIPVGEATEIPPPRTRRENNASGESSASQEAINRMAREKALGQERVLVDRDGTVRPLIGPTAVDQNARAGQVIAQRGIGAKEWTVLSSGPEMTKGAVARALAKLPAKEPKGFEKGAKPEKGSKK